MKCRKRVIIDGLSGGFEEVGGEAMVLRLTHKLGV